ncbi:hypothetical protein LY01_01445 [Nonlabens xylanidelens]|uniref:Uncharacterized protein n=1 Tax=Nonlabens xylanidelens TaxID=191564 RepID=A0A2S6INL7_9FLAO|nr:hypothetical protein LY01_01445 [Nonlabens xylanidelens]
MNRTVNFNLDMKKGYLTRYQGYEKHLRKYLKRKFWKGERFEEKKEIKKHVN